MLPRILLALAMPVAIATPAAAQTRAATAKLDTGTVAGATQGTLTVFKGIPYAVPGSSALRSSKVTLDGRGLPLRTRTAIG